MNNIYNQLYSKETSSLIHYINGASCFDTLIDQILMEDIVRFSKIEDGQYFTIKNILLNDYRPFISGNYPNKYYLAAQLEVINLFIYTDLSFMKREDIFLIQNRLESFNVINFHPNNKEIFKNTIIPAVPKIKIANTTKNNKVLIIDNNNNKYLSEILKKTPIDLIDFSSYNDYYSLLSSISEYSLVVYTNYIDGLVSSSVGCSIIPSSSIIKNKKIVQSDIVSNTKTNYDFDTFSKRLIKAIKK